MRIISGTARGRKLYPPPINDRNIRPTSDRAREALFNILTNQISGARVLDLFAGTGAIGLEAYSRSAAGVAFVDSSPQAITLINKNIQRCLRQTQDSASLHVIKYNLAKGLPESGLQQLGLVPFDYIFADPPYEHNFSLAVLQYLSKSSLTGETTKIIIEERHKVILPEKIENLTLYDRRRYGEAAFWFYCVC